MICPNTTDPGNSTIIKTDVGFSAGLFTGYETEFNNCPSANNTGTTSINDFKANFAIYPNPVKEMLTIKGVYTSVNIYDVFGKLVLSTDYQNTIDVSTLSNGVYFVNIKAENTITVKKVTIAK
jgi:hypothetical protein